METITFLDIHGAEQTLDTDGKFNVAFNADCMDLLRAMPDNCVDLAVCDPPYGDALQFEDIEHRNQRGRFDRYNESSQTVNVEREREREKHPDVQPLWRSGKPIQEIQNKRRLRFHGGGKKDPWRKYLTVGDEGSQDRRDLGGEVRKKIIAWDVAPGKEYFDELFRVSQAQIIWGGNYFSLPPTRCFLIWRKLSISESFSMAMAEYAWTSFNSNAKVFECAPQGKASDPRFHPTAKPIDLYRWIFANYAKPGMTILDTHLGSGSSRIAAYEAGLNFVGTEIDERYFQQEEDRFERMTQNISFWDQD